MEAGYLDGHQMLKLLLLKSYSKMYTCGSQRNPPRVTMFLMGSSLYVCRVSGFLSWIQSLILWKLKISAGLELHQSHLIPTQSSYHRHSGSSKQPLLHVEREHEPTRKTKVINGRSNALSVFFLSNFLPPAYKIKPRCDEENGR